MGFGFLREGKRVWFGLFFGEEREMEEGCEVSKRDLEIGWWVSFAVVVIVVGAREGREMCRDHFACVHCERISKRGQKMHFFLCLAPTLAGSAVP